MQIGHPAGAAQTGNAPANANIASLRIFVFALFFIFGGITSLNDVIIPKLKELFTLSYAQAMLVQSASSPPISSFRCRPRPSCSRIGYMRTAVVGLLTMTAGCLLFIPASSSSLFGAVPAGAVRAGGRHHHRAGGGQSADLDAGRAADGAAAA